MHSFTVSLNDENSSEEKFNRVDLDFINSKLPNILVKFRRNCNERREINPFF